MTDGFEREQLNSERIEVHLKSAVDALVPDVLDRIDLSLPQEVIAPVPRIVKLTRRLHVLGTAAAACFCAVLLTGGVYAYQNGKVDSRIGIDVNPSIELSVNRRNKVLDAEALNEDAREILDDMDLDGVNLDVAVNALVGSMVKHGYLQDPDNTILVTVSNDSVRKATDLREIVVGDIQESLEENQVKAVVYDQQAVEDDELKQLAGEYRISYGKAYFLKELIDQNPRLTMEDMSELAPLTMEEIAGVISETEPAERDPKEERPAMTASASVAGVESEPAGESQTPSSGATKPGETTEPPSQAEGSEPETTGEVVVEGKIQIDYTDYDDGSVSVNFTKKVRWKNPTVSVRDESGNVYSAMMGDTSSTSCEIYVDDLEEGLTYTFVIGGIYSASGNRATTVTGSFETPIVSPDATKENGETVGEKDEEEDGETETTVNHTEPGTTEAPTDTPEESRTEAEPTEAPSVPDTSKKEETGGEQ